MDVGNRIRQLREAKHYTVNGLANRAGVSQSYLRDLELNNKNPTVETLSAICWALGISLRDFFTEDSDYSFSKNPVLKAVYGLSREQQAALLTFLQSLSNND